MPSKFGQAVKRLSEFDIDLVRLKPGKHEFTYKLDTAFFDFYDYGIVHDGSLDVNILLERSTVLLNFDIKIKGVVKLTCDRSLEEFDHPLAVHDQVMIKFGDEEKELADNVFVIKADKPSINLADTLYELITVAVPIKKLHPKFADEENDEDSLVYTSLTEEEQHREEEEKEEEIDPRWKELLKLKNNK